MVRSRGGGLRAAYHALQQALVEDQGARPRQLTMEDQPRAQRSRRSGDETERSETPETQRRRPAAPDPTASRSTRRDVLRRELHDRASIHRAILTHEIIDRPRALRPYEWQ